MKPNGSLQPNNFFSIQMAKFMGTFGLSRDITSHKLLEIERESLVQELTKTLKELKTLRGLIPICASCKKIRDDESGSGSWQDLEAYLLKHSEAEFTHGICDDCARKLYPELYQ